jgi:hypothetical protein
LQHRFTEEEEDSMVAPDEKPNITNFSLKSTLFTGFACHNDINDT